MQLVALGAIAQRIGQTVEEVTAECEALGIHIGDNWAGRPAVEEKDARGLVDGSARRKYEAEAAWLRHIEDCERYAAKRSAAVKRVFEVERCVALGADGCRCLAGTAIGGFVPGPEAVTRSFQGRE